MDDMESERRPRQPLMLKEWLELESLAELSRDGFGCYPRHLPAELRSASSGSRRRNGDVIARFLAAVRTALSRPPAGREGEVVMAALSRSLSRRLRVGFWKKRKGEAEEMETDRPVASCSAATAASSGRWDAPSSPAMSPRRVSWEGRQAGGDGAGLGGGRRSHETATMKVEGCEGETTCHLDEEREQRLSPVSVMDFLSQDGDDGNDDDCNEHVGSNNGHNGASPTFERSLANIQRASQQLLQRIRRFEQLAEVGTSDMDDATTTAEDETSCHIEELDSTGDEEDAEGARDLLGLPEAVSPSPSPCAAAPAAPCFRRLLQDFFREGLTACHDGGSDDPEVERALLETAKAWLDGRHRASGPDGKAEMEEIERFARWRCFREDEQELLGSDVDDGIFWSLMEELVDDLCCLSNAAT